MANSADLEYCRPLLDSHCSWCRRAGDRSPVRDLDARSNLLWSKTRAVLICAGFFTLHHIILMIAYCDDWRLIYVGSIAVFIAGVLWARCAKIYNSLLPSYLSHLAADLALQIVSWHVLLS
jgi:hypothetical protein